jgi:hypothetical protein
VGVDAKAVEFDLVLPIVAGGHSFGQDRATGIDVLEEQDLKDVAALPGPGNWRHALALVLRNKDNGCDAFACSLRSLTPRICGYASFPGRHCFCRHYPDAFALDYSGSSSLDIASNRPR